MGKVKPLPPEPTMRDLAGHQIDTHNCLEEAREDIRDIIDTQGQVQKDLEAQIALAQERHDATIAYQELMLKAFQIDPKRAKGNTLGTKTPIELAAFIMGVTAASLSLWQWIAKLSPDVLVFLTHINHTVTH